MGAGPGQRHTKTFFERKAMHAATIDDPLKRPSNETEIGAAPVGNLFRQAYKEKRGDDEFEY